MSTAASSRGNPTQANETGTAQGKEKTDVKEAAADQSNDVAPASQ
jgi:hypothetical protein